MKIFNIRPTGLNVGNSLIHLSLSRLIELAAQEKPSILSIPASSKDSRKISSGLSSSSIYEINGSGDGLVIGGGNLFENNELTIDFNAIKKISVNNCIFSVSYGRVFNKEKKLIERTDCMPDQDLIRVCNSINRVGCRDEATFDKLSGLGCNNIDIVGCPTIHLSRFFSKSFLENLSLSLDNDKKRCLISIRSINLISIPFSEKNKISKLIIHAINSVKKEGLIPTILCHDRRDLEFAESLSDNQIEYIVEEDVYRYLALVVNARLLITLRLHSFIPRMSYELPAINIIYDERALSLSKFYGLEQFCINALDGNAFADLDDLIKISLNENIKKEINKINKSNDWSNNYDFQIKFLKKYLLKKVL